MYVIFQEEQTICFTNTKVDLIWERNLLLSKNYHHSTFQSWIGSLFEDSTLKNQIFKKFYWILYYPSQKKHFLQTFFEYFYIYENNTISVEASNLYYNIWIILHLLISNGRHLPSNTYNNRCNNFPHLCPIVYICCLPSPHALQWIKSKVGNFLKHKAGFVYHLIIGPLVWECPHPNVLPSI